MAEKQQVLKEKVEHTGVFDFKGVYSYSHGWFSEEGFGVTEEKYSEKTKGDAKDITVEWKITKDISDYFRFEYKVKFEVEGMTDVEVEIDGARKRMNKGKISVEITGTLVMDRDAKWESSAWNRMMRDIYNKYIIPSRVDDMQTRVSSKAVEFKDNLKTYMNLSARR